MNRKACKVLVWGAVFAALAYVVLASLVLCYLPKQVAKEESRIPAIQRAIAESAADQELLSRRINAITDKVQRNNGNRTAVTHGMLSDPDINRLARNYLGADFALSRSSFMGQIKHAYSLLNSQREVYVKDKTRKNELKKKLQELESQKKFLLDSPHMSSSDRYGGGGAWHRDEALQRKMDDIDSQLVRLREIELDRQLKSASAQDYYTTEKAKLEKTIFGICDHYERSTVRRLEQTIAERKAAFQDAINRIAFLRDTYDVLNIWPLPALKRAFFE